MYNKDVTVCVCGVCVCVVCVCVWCVCVCVCGICMYIGTHTHKEV